MKSCIKLGGSLINHKPTLIEITGLIKEGEWDFLFGAGNEFSSMLKRYEIKFHYEPNKWGIEERVIDKPDLTNDALRLLLPIQSRRLTELREYFHNPTNVNFIGPIYQMNESLININPDTYIFESHGQYQRCIVYTLEGSSKSHFDPIVIPRGNVEIRWVSKY